MRGDVSRIDRALDILRLDANATAETLADALWLANAMPPATRPEKITSSGTQHGEETKESIDGKPSDQESPPRAGVDHKKPEENRGIYLPGNAVPEGREAYIPASFVTVPAADPLPNRLPIERALKSFLKRFPSRRLKQLDGERTAEASADRKSITPVFRPQPERWFDVLLLVERSDAMEVWNDTVRELQRLMARHGAFRNARVVQFSVGGNAVRLLTPAGQPLSANAAMDPEGRRICLFLTNGTSREWRKPTLIEFVKRLGRRTVVAILQMLPSRIWTYTALGDALERTYSLEPGSANAALRVEDPFSAIAKRAVDASCIPVLTLTPDGIENWARFVMSPRRTVAPAVLLMPETEKSPEAIGPRTPEQRLAEFREIASFDAFQLLRILAGVPLTLPVMRLVQQSVSASREQFHLSEVMLSGLLERVTGADEQVAADGVYYDFVPGVRELLLGTLSTREAQGLDVAMRPAQERMREFVESHIDRKYESFRALLADRAGTEKLPASAKAFVEVSRRIFERRGILAPETRGGRRSLVEIEPMSLVDAQIRSAAVSGQGRYVAAALPMGNREWVQLWDRESGQPLLERSLPSNQFRVLSAGNSDLMFAAAEGVLILLPQGPGEASHKELPFKDSLTAVSPDGLRLYSREVGGVREFSIEQGRSIQVHSRAGKFGPPTALAAGDRIVAAGYANGDVDVYSGVTIANMNEAVGALAVSRDALVILTMLESGKVLALPAKAQLDVTTATAIAMTGDGMFAAVGCQNGWLSVWDLSRIELIAEIRHGNHPLTSVSISASGDYAVSASADGLKSWDLRALMAVARPLAIARKAPVARKVTVYGDALAMNLVGQVTRALQQAGHLVTSGADQRGATAAQDYIVLVNESSIANPYLPDALTIHTEDRIQWLLREIERDPPGSMFNLPPILQNMIERPVLDKRLREFLLRSEPGSKCFLVSEPYAGEKSALLKVVMSDVVRRAFPGGISWNAALPAYSRRGKSLLITLDENGPKDPSEGSVVLRLVSAADSSARVFDFPFLEPEEAAAHLRRVGLPPGEIERLSSFHNGIPMLVSLAAGAFVQGVSIEVTPEEPVNRTFKRVTGDILAALNPNVRWEVVRLSAHSAEDPTDYIPNGVEVARSCGWLLMRGNIPLVVGRVKELVADLYPNETAHAHETICARIEELCDTPNPTYFPKPDALDHALLAGGQDRLEQLLRHPAILRHYLQQTRRDLAQKIQPFAADHDFFQKLLKECTGRTATPTIEHVYELLAPAMQWPVSSGVADAHSQKIRGKGTRVVVPGGACNTFHPEFGGRGRLSNSPPARSRNSIDYGTGICSVIAGLNIGVAPEVTLEPVEVLDANQSLELVELEKALVGCLEAPPDILFLALASSVLDSPSIGKLVGQLLTEDVLVVVPRGQERARLFTAGQPNLLIVGACDFNGDVSGYWGTDVSLHGYGAGVRVAKAAEVYEIVNGTTYAAAYVAGVAALYAQAMGIRGAALGRLLLSTVDPKSRVARYSVATDMPEPQLA